MKRIIAFLLALTLVFGICACGKSNNGSAGSDTESKTAQDYAEAAYVAMISMMSGMYDGNTTKVYRFDYDHDGIDDWLVHYDDAQQFWMLFKGGESQPTPTIFFNWGAAGSLQLLYSEADDSIYIKNAYSVITHGYESYFCYDGTAHDYCLSTSYVDDPSAAVESGKYYYIGEKETTQQEYEKELNKLELRELPDATRGFSSFFDQPADMLESIAELISQYPFVTECFTKDIDGDGVDEYIFGTKIENKESPTERPCGVPGVSYECGNEPYENSYGFNHLWKNPYFALSSNKSGVASHFFIADDLVAKPTATAAPEPASTAKVTNNNSSSSSSSGKNSKLFDKITEYGGEWWDRKGFFVGDRFNKDGTFLGGLIPGQGTWKVCGSNKIEITMSGKTTVYTVEFEYDDGKIHDFMVMKSDSETYRYFRRNVSRYKSLYGVWSYESNGTELNILSEGDYAFGSDKGMWCVSGDTLVLLREFPDGSLGDYTYFDIVGDRLRLSAKNSRAEDAPVNKVYYEKIGCE